MGYKTGCGQRWRTLVRVVWVQPPHVYAVVHVRDPYKVFRFPLWWVDDSECRVALENFDATTRLFARVNVGCERDEDLQFSEFEMAPQIRDSDDWRLLLT